ncbi:hypothetical protein IJ556_04060 [bacterium]|nr:hypothetical protein [bacterium]
MEMTVANYRGEVYKIQMNICFVEQSIAIGKILIEIGISETESYINQLFWNCRHISKHNQVEYVLSRLTAKKYPNSNVLSVFIPEWRDWLIKRICSFLHCEQYRRGNENTSVSPLLSFTLRNLLSLILRRLLQFGQ